MTCSQELIEAYLDEELDAGHKAAVEEHLAGCQNCSQNYSHMRERKIQVRSLGYSAPPQLRRSVTEGLRQEAASAKEPEARVAAWWRWAAAAASVLLAVSLFWNVSRFRPGAAENDLVARDVVSSHVRSLMGTHLLDVPSSDQHTVKPWFNGKLDFSPNVKDFAAEGFPLAGGRVDYLTDKPVAALIYHRRQHVINLFTWPATESDAARHFSRVGYNVVHWVDGGMTYWAVSDVAMGELYQFQELYQK